MSGKRPYEIEDAEDPEQILPEGYSVDRLDTSAPELQEYTIVVCFEDESRSTFLMARHNQRGWELPGGRVHPSENPLIGAVREFGEETGHRLQKAQIAFKLGTDQGTCWVITGRWGPAVEGHEPAPDEPIQETRFVSSIHDVEPLAWPDDPYQRIENELGVKLR